MAEQFLVRTGPTALTGSVVTQHTNAATSGYQILDSVLLCNTTGAPVNVRLHLIPSGGSATTGNAILYDTPVEANDVVHMENLFVPLYNGDFLQALGSGVTLTMTITGYKGRGASTR